MRDLSNAYRYNGAEPYTFQKTSFAEPLPKISKQFCDIYNEALAAETYGLTQKCGVGYRKSLEFLMKDYLIGRTPGQEHAIKSAPLGACISNYVSDDRIKDVAQRATWLGNDETHYVRVWADKDVGDLKDLYTARDTLDFERNI